MNLQVREYKPSDQFTLYKLTILPVTDATVWANVMETKTAIWRHYNLSKLKTDEMCQMTIWHSTRKKLIHFGSLEKCF